jgi:hypothetical protein
MDRTRYNLLINPAVAMVSKKGADYNIGPALHDYFPFADKSYVQMIHLKALRTVSLTSVACPNYESMEDTLYDLLNYIVFYLDYLENQKCKHTALNADI